MKKNESTKNEMTTTEFKKWLASLWWKAHAFEDAWRKQGECDDAAYEEQTPIVMKLADEFVSEFEKHESRIFSLFDPKTAAKEAKKVGSDCFWRALYCYGWWQEADGFLTANED